MEGLPNGDGSKQRTAIIGAGIGGLAAAVALSCRGFSVDVYEAAPELQQIGAGIQITPNASRQLIAWGVDRYLPDLTSRPPCFKVRRWANGEMIGRMSTERYHEKFGGPYVQLHRADLQKALFQKASSNGVRVYTNSRIVDIDVEAPAIVLEDGQTVQVDLVIAADGIKSLGRRKISGREDAETVSPGLAVFRAAVDMNEVMQYPELAHIATEPGLNLWVGPHSHVVTYAMRGDSLVNLVLEHPEQRPTSEWDESKYLNHIKELYASWDPNLRQLINLIHSTPMKWPLRFSVPLERWSSSSGRFVLLGDASHVVPPFLAQGAAMAIEDATLLSSMLSQSSHEDLAKSLQVFERERLDRKIKVQELSLRNLQVYHLEDGDEQMRRDGKGTEDGVDEVLPIWKSESDQAWLYGHIPSVSPVANARV